MLGLQWIAPKEQVLAIFEKSFGCGHCHLHDACPVADADANDSYHEHPTYEGFGFLMSAMLAFVLPLMTAMAGAYLAGQCVSPSSVGSLGRWQALGMAGGLVMGVILAKLLLGLIRQGRASTGYEK